MFERCSLIQNGNRVKRRIRSTDWAAVDCLSCLGVFVSLNDSDYSSHFDADHNTWYRFGCLHLACWYSHQHSQAQGKIKELNPISIGSCKILSNILYYLFNEVKPLEYNIFVPNPLQFDPMRRKITCTSFLKIGERKYQSNPQILVYLKWIREGFNEEISMRKYDWMAYTC